MYLIMYYSTHVEIENKKLWFNKQTAYELVGFTDHQQLAGWLTLAIVTARSSPIIIMKLPGSHMLQL